MHVNLQCIQFHCFVNKKTCMKENYFSCCIKKLSDEVTNLAGYAISHSPLKVNTALYYREIVARCNTQFLHIPTAAESRN